MHARSILPLLLLLPALAAAQSPAPPRRIPLDGPKIYQYHCATCHGSDGRGHGPASAALKQPVQDLTLISQRNRGRFPYQHVKEIIDGTQIGPSAHGTREMPIWGPIFHEVDADQDWGEVRLDAVTKQVESMQQK